MKKKINKSAFIRSLGNIPAKEAVARAKKAGFVVSEKYVHTIRYNAKHQKGDKSAKRGRPGRPPKVAVTTFGNAEETPDMAKKLIAYRGNGGVTGVCKKCSREAAEERYPLP